MRAREWLFGIAVVGAWGCSFQASPAAITDGGQPSPAPIDAPPGTPTIDGPPTAPCATFSSLVDTCKLKLDQDLALGPTSVFDTDAETLDGQKLPATQRARTPIQGVEVELVLAHNVNLPVGTLRVIGTRPLAVIASGTFVTGNNAKIDLSIGGAGARPTCPTGATSGGGSNGGSGGGGGGGFGDVGGAGGTGDQGKAAGGGGGQASAMPPGLIGGCAGAQGGHGGGAQGGPSGKAGGALYIAAGVAITLGDGASINAGGEGGHRGAHVEDGGGGGGSGGMIFLQSPQVSTVNAVLAANGGGGGGGNDESLTPGQDGAPGQASQAVATGGAGAQFGSAGGNGGTIDHPAGFDVAGNPQGAGGGGGGSVGFIRVLSAQPSLGTASPAAIVK